MHRRGEISFPLHGFLTYRGKKGAVLLNKKKGPSTSDDMKKLEAIIALVPSDRRAVAEKLGGEIAFMSRILERLRQEVDAGCNSRAPKVSRPPGNIPARFCLWSRSAGVPVPNNWLT